MTDYDNLKILVLGTPKTGNTWISHLFADIYGLHQVGVDPRFDPDRMEGLGRRWIAKQHFLPHRAWLDWCAVNDVVVICPVRHPGDVLVSLWHHMRKNPSDEFNVASMLLEDRVHPADATRRFVEEGFFLYLNISIAWTAHYPTVPIRYESLWDRPLETLQAATRRIIPVSDEYLIPSICACEFALMQELFDPARRIVRRGGVGAWRTELPEDVRRLLAEADPYPDQFAALGYSMDPDDPANLPRPSPGTVIGPFGSERRFANGARVSPLLMRAYQLMPAARKEQWGDPASVGAGSFFAWLNRPAAEDPDSARTSPVVTELGAYLHALRPDVRAVMPDLYGANRVDFTDWFLGSGRVEYHLHSAFLEPVLRSWCVTRPITRSPAVSANGPAPPRRPPP